MRGPGCVEDVASATTGDPGSVRGSIACDLTAACPDAHAAAFSTIVCKPAADRVAVSGHHWLCARCGTSVDEAPRSIGCELAGACPGADAAADRSVSVCGRAVVTTGVSGRVLRFT